ncbi:MAG: MAPEG family protein [Paracoccaceae bacterium]|nr:MAPEG family protein [Paracoccaceae bacterium]
MSNELTMLAYSGLVVLLIILVHVLLAAASVGLAPLAGPRDDALDLSTGAARMKRAADNAIHALALFAPAVLILNAQGVSTTGTIMAAQIFLIVRILHPVIYYLGIPWLRTLVWLCGFLATAWLYLQAL